MGRRVSGTATVGLENSRLYSVTGARLLAGRAAFCLATVSAAASGGVGRRGPLRPVSSRVAVLYLSAGLTSLTSR